MCGALMFLIFFLFQVVNFTSVMAANATFLYGPISHRMPRYKDLSTTMDSEVHLSEMHLQLSLMVTQYSVTVVKTLKGKHLTKSSNSTTQNVL